MGARAQTGRHSFTGEGALRTCKRCSVADAATSGASCGMLTEDDSGESCGMTSESSTLPCSFGDGDNVEESEGTMNGGVLPP
jgi:hypothetical protein